jgi:cell division protein FtsQ
MGVKRKRLIGILVVSGLLLCCLIASLLISRGKVYHGVRVRLLYHSDTLVTSEDLKSYIRAHCPSVDGRVKQSVSLSQIGSCIRRWPYADTVRVTADMKGCIHVEVVQAKVLLHVINSKGASFYLSKVGHTGRMLPYLPGHPVHVAVASGAIPDTCRPNQVLEWQDSSVCHDLMGIASFIDRNPFWKAQISQIYVRKKGDYCLVPTVGNHLVELGGADGLQQKFDNLWNIYSQGFNVAGWQRYDKVSLQFGDRVPCEKRTI